MTSYQRLVLSVYKRDGWKCRNPMCKSRNNLTPHHILFRSKGGKNTLENLITLCIVCHNAIHDRTLKIENGKFICEKHQ